MKLSRYNKEEFANLVTTGKSYHEIMEEYGITYSATRQRVQQLKREGYITQEYDGRQRNGRKVVRRTKGVKMGKEEFITRMLILQGERIC